MKYIDAEKLKATLETRIAAGLDGYGGNLKWLLEIIDSLQQETLEISLDKFTEKMEDWKARYNYPDNIPIKATMGFTARMFYQYPNVARQWYDGLPKVTLD